MANLISLSRLPLLLALVWMAYRPVGWWQIAATGVLVVVFTLDAIDGAVARRRGESSPFGAVLDIAVDRAVELGFWFLLVDLGAAPLWAALVFVIRGALVDALRAARLDADGVEPFDAFSSPFARWVVKGRFMRGFYAAMKGIAFGWLLFFVGAPALIEPLAPALWATVAPWIALVGQTLVWIVVALCVLRGLPDLLEYPRQIARSLRAGGLSSSRR